MYLLRWRFDYFDTKPPKYGMWSRPAVLLSDMAAFISKENLRVASIEAKHVETREVISLAECEGCDFVNFQWIAQVRYNIGIGTQNSQLIGLKLVTRDTSIEVYPSGDIKILNRSEHDKQFHFEGFGR